jgi:hypothetical protein
MVPAGQRLVVDRAEAAALPDVLPEVTGVLRVDSRRTRLAVWAALVEHMAPDGTITAGHERLAVRASVHAGRRVARSTVGNHVRDLVAAGVVLLAQAGASRDTLGGTRDRAPTYVLLAPDYGDQAAHDDVPLTADELAEVARLGAQLDAMTAAAAGHVDELGHLPERSAPALAVDIYPPRKSAENRRSEALSEPATPARRATPGRFAPRSAAERSICAAWLAAIMGWPVQDRTEKELLKITGPYFTAGWSPLAILHAWRHQPGGEPWPGPLPEPHRRDQRDRIQIRNLWAVLTHRLAAWRGPAGVPLDPPVPTEQPRRGRPRRSPPAPARPGPVRADRPAEVDAALAALAARHAARRAELNTQQAHRAQRLADFTAATRGPDLDDQPAAPPAPGDLARRRALLRAHIERRDRDRDRTA